MSDQNFVNLSCNYLNKDFNKSFSRSKSLHGAANSSKQEAVKS